MLFYFNLLLQIFKVNSYDFDYNTVANNFISSDIIQDNFENVQEGKFRFWLTTDCLNILYEVINCKSLSNLAK